MNNTLLKVSELFYSIQGESSFAGLPCCFIRLSGCNLRCNYCDSDYTWSETGNEMKASDLTEWLNLYPHAIVEFTGGEPLLQKGVYQVFDTLLANGRTVLLETNGSLNIYKVPAAVSTILDIKCPDSGMDSHVDWTNIEILYARKNNGSRDEIKFVLSSENDFHWASETIKLHELESVAPIIFSPVCNRFPAEKLAELILDNQLSVRLQLQLHSILWPSIKRGV